MYARIIVTILMSLWLSACESTMYNALEKVGVHKRDILVDRIEDAQTAQVEGQEQFQDALTRFRQVVNFDGGDLEKTYDQLKNEFDDSEAAADAITDRIEAVESVAEALFEEWEEELDQYTSDNLRRASAQQLRDTKSRYKRLITAMHKAEKTMAPVLNALRDNVLYLKHNLNARAISSLKGELRNIDSDVARLTQAMRTAIEQSNQFIKEMRKPE